VFKTAHKIVACFAFVVSLAGFPGMACGLNASPYKLSWIRGGFLDRRDQAAAVVTDTSGSVYVAGDTGPVLGMPDNGPAGALVAKYSPTGDLIWQQLAYLSYSEEATSAMAIDAASNVFITGTNYRYPPNAEAFLVKYSAEGTLGAAFGDAK
jgi:hypothetical protein